MSLSRIFKILRKDFALGPRSPFVLYTIALPIVLTLVFQGAFGSLFAAQPRLAIYDEGGSAVAREIQQLDGIDLTMLGSAEAVRDGVEANDYDAGLILPRDFDAALLADQQPTLQFYMSGESYASNRVILSVTAIDAIRAVGNQEPPVDVKVVNFGEEGLPLSVRLIPIIVFYALVMAGVFVPGSNLVEEKEKGTLMALLVSPVKTGEVLVAKWLFGVTLATVMSMVTLIINSAVGPRPFEVFAVVLLAAAMTSMMGVLVGVVSKNSTMLFGLIKGLGVLLFAPAIFYVFPDWPQWIAKLFPLYWVIEPIWAVAVAGEPISSVLLEIGVATGITVALLPVILWLARKMQAQMAAG